MSDKRPTVSPQLTASVIESAPDRVRRRLDRTPDAASGWSWLFSETQWSVDTGGETVTLPGRHIHSITQLSCTCLLSPQCFHVLACLTSLEVVLVEDQEEPSSIDNQQTLQTVSQDATDDNVQPTENQRRAASELAKNLTHLLRVGVANAGVVIQSGLLRAVHQCRAAGLHRLGAVGLRVIAGTNQFRARSAESDPAQLAEDIADALETTQHLLHEQAVPSFWIGTARRRQFPVRPRKLHGLVAEPIITRSGFAGAAAYFLGEDDNIYTASEVRPGDAQLARDAYLGGIEIGSMIQPAKQLARRLYLGTDLTASKDGRLGRGKSIRIVEQGQSSWDAEAIQKRFRRPLPEQWNAVYAGATLPADARPAGWDFVFLTGSVVGAFGPELLFHLINEDQTIRLGIANESESLYFRENLRMLSHAPGLKLQVIARLNLLEPTLVYLLALAAFEDKEEQKDRPRIVLPKTLHGRVFTGFDEIANNQLVGAQAKPVILNEQKIASPDDPLVALRRRWLSTMLAGTVSHGQGNLNSMSAEIGMLKRGGFSTGAALLDALSRSAATNALTDTFLAAALYLRHCRYELAKTLATMSI